MESLPEVKPPEPKPEPKPEKKKKPAVPLSLRLKTKINAKRNEMLKEIYQELQKKNPDWELILLNEEAHTRLVNIKSLLATHPPKHILAKK